MTEEEIQKNSEHWYNKYKDAEKRIAELEKENNKLLDVINNQDVKIADLEKQIPVWHDLRKDPKDLPLTEKEVMVFIEWKNTENETEYAYDLGTRRFNGDWCLDVFSSEDKDTKVIAWYDFPQFKE